VEHGVTRPGATDPARQDRLAGSLALAAGLCWFIWAIVNVVAGQALDHPANRFSALISASLTAGWNLLLIPAALRLYLRFRRLGAPLLLVATLAGIVSMSLWAAGGVLGIPRGVETAYLVLAAVWLIVLGLRVRPEWRRFGTFTLVVGGFTALDAAFNLFEPVPFAVYLLASPKLPLAAAWSLTAGVLLVRASPEADGRAPRAAA
jgi:hypothetical protein